VPEVSQFQHFAFKVKPSVTFLIKTCELTKLYTEFNTGCYPKGASASKLTQGLSRQIKYRIGTCLRCQPYEPIVGDMLPRWGVFHACHTCDVPDSKLRTGPCKYREGKERQFNILERFKSPSKAPVKFGGSNEVEVFRHPYLKCSCALLFLADRGAYLLSLGNNMMSCGPNFAGRVACINNTLDANDLDFGLL
jgi:hypothetical protein